MYLYLPAMTCLAILCVPVGSLPPLPDPLVAAPRVEHLDAAAWRALIEHDWLQDTQPSLSTQADAAGACDGVKNGLYGFHTNYEVNPWWQVDFGRVRQIGRILVYNRLDYAPGLHNADSIHVLASADGAAWSLIHDNGGHHFGGVHGAPPLALTFDKARLEARYVRIVIPGDHPVFLHLDEVEVYAPGDDITNIALRAPADQSSLSVWSTAKITVPRDYPIREWIDRGFRTAAHLQGQGVDTSPWMEGLNLVAGKAAQLAPDASEQERRALYVAARWAVRRIVFQHPLLDLDRLLFVKRFTQETYPDVCLNHMPWVSRPGGDICILSPAEGGGGLFAALAEPPADANAPAVANVTHLLNGALGPGRVHGMDLWFEGGRIVFGYARTRNNDPPEGWLDRTQSYRLRIEEEPIHLFELSLGNGGIRQVTSGEWSDLDPTYAPNGDIVFVSERCGTSLQCNEYDKDETSCNLYVVRPDGSGIRRLSVNKDGDYLPHCLDNGMIGYTRWEYQERSFAFIQSLWVVRPDGTGADALFAQHLENPWALEDVRSIPQSDKYVAIATGHHTLAVGPLVVIDPARGMNSAEGIAIVTPGVLPPEGGMSGVAVPEGGTQDMSGFYSTPWALSESVFLVSYTYGSETTNPTGYGLYLVDVFGNKELVYRDPEISSFIPVPFRPRPLPHVLPEAIDLELDYAVCHVSDISHGSEGIAPEDVHYLRIAEPVGWPYTIAEGGHRYGEDHRYGGPDADRRNLTNWTPLRILGDVPVNPDGSAHFQVPPDTAVYFQLLDENRMELRRMRSFISFQPGEKRSCVGCHESREAAAFQPRNYAGNTGEQQPSTLIPAPWGDRPVSFLRDVQPVLDKQCVRCHSGLSPAAGLDFLGGLIAWDEEVPHYGHNRAFETILEHDLVDRSPARMQDASVTPPFAYGSRKSKLLTVLGDAMHAAAVNMTEEDRLRLALWIDANAPYHDRFVNKRCDKPVYDLAGDKELQATVRDIHENRCSTCHETDAVSRLDWIDFYSPERSLFLRTPLAAAAGGDERCGAPVYGSTDDPEYARVLEIIQHAVNRAWLEPRRDMQSLNRLAWLFRRKEQQK